MGKIKRQRKKLHTPSAKNDSKEGAEHKQDEMETGLLQPSVIFPSKGLFAGASLNTTPPSHIQGGNDDDRMSFVSKKSVKGNKQLTKIEKRKLRHNRWLEKMDTINTVKRKEKDAKRRADAPVVGDMHPLQDALPELSEILRIGPHYAAKKSSSGASQHKKPRATLKMKDRQKLVLEETARFQEVLKHSAFKSSPFATINEHLKNKLKQEQEQDQT